MTKQLRARIGDAFDLVGAAGENMRLAPLLELQLSCTRCGWRLRHAIREADAILAVNPMLEVVQHLVYAWEMHEIERELRGRPYGLSEPRVDGTFTEPSGIAVRTIDGTVRIDTPVADLHAALVEHFGEEASVAWDRDCGDVVIEHALVDTQSRSVAFGDDEAWWCGEWWERDPARAENLAPIVCPARDRRRPGLRAAWDALAERAKRCGVELLEGPSAEEFEYEAVNLPGPDGGYAEFLSREFETPWDYMDRLHRLIGEFDPEIPERARAELREWLGTDPGY